MVAHARKNDEHHDIHFSRRSISCVGCALNCGGTTCSASGYLHPRYHIDPMFFNIALIVLNDGTPGKKSEHNKPVSVFLELSLTRLLSFHEAFVSTTRCFGALRFLSATSRSGLPIGSATILTVSVKSTLEAWSHRVLKKLHLSGNLKV